MSNPSVLIRMGAEDAEALAGWVRQQRAIKNTENELKRLKDVSKESNDQLLSGFLKTYTAAGIAQRAFSAVTSEIKRQFDEIRDMQRRADESAVTVEQATARFRVQTMPEQLSDEQRTQVEQGIVGQGVQYGYKPQQSLEFARELYSQGVAMDQIAGSLDAVFQFARSQDRELTVDLLKALVTQTRANDPKLGAQSFREAAQLFFGAWQKQPLQPQDLEAFARANIGLAAAGVEQRQQLAVNVATLNLTGSAEQAATLSKLLAVRMQAPTPEAQRAIESLGIDKADIDLVGEDLFTAVDRLGDALERMPQEQQVPIVREIFGGEYAGQFRELLNRRDTLPEIAASVDQGVQFMGQAVEQMMGTAQARTQRVEAMTEGERAERGVAIASAIDAELTRQREMDYTRGGMLWDMLVGFTGGQADLARSVVRSGETPEQMGDLKTQFRNAVDAIAMEMSLRGEDDAEELKRRAQELYENVFRPFGLSQQPQLSGGLQVPPAPQAALPPPLPAPEPPAAPPAPAPGLDEQASAKLDATNELLSRLLDRFNSPLAVESLDIPAPNGVAYRSGPPLANA